MSWEFQMGEEPPAGAGRRFWEWRFPNLGKMNPPGGGMHPSETGNGWEFPGIPGKCIRNPRFDSAGNSTGKLWKEPRIVPSSGNWDKEGRSGKEFSKLDSGSKHPGKIRGRSRQDEFLIWKRRRQKLELFHKLWMRKLLETILKELGNHKTRETPALDPSKFPEFLEALAALPSRIQEFLGKSRGN